MQPSKAFIIALFIAALVGFADASFITAKHAQGVIPPCGVEGCETVLTSRFSQVAGIPVSVAGMLFYGTILVGLIAYLDIGDRRLLHGIAWLSCAGFIAALFFVAIQLFVLHAVCLYCMASALTSTALFVLSVWFMRRY
jgi:uncharacterized membrane protein